MSARSHMLFGVLILAVSFSSCTCHKEQESIPAAPSSVEKRPPAFSLERKATPTGVSAAPSPQKAAGVPSPAPNLALPTDFPSDIPVFDGSSLAAVQQLGGGAHNVLFTTPAAPREIFDFYKDDLKNKGYDVTQQYQTEEQSFLSFKKGNLITNVVIAADPNDRSRRVIAVMYQVQEDVEEF